MPSKPSKFLKALPGKAKPRTMPQVEKLAGKSPAGRPPSNLGQYLIKPTPETNTGFEMLNQTPDAIKQVHEKYLKAFQLPPALQPKYLRKPEVMEANRSKSISRGWRKPRSLLG